MANHNLPSQPESHPLDITELRAQLEAAGAPEIVLDHLTPYTEANAPYIYTGPGPREMANGSGGQASDGSESRVIVDLQVATDRPIGEVIAGNGYSDQTPQVRAQWRSREYPRKPGSSYEVERDEVEEVADGTYVRRTYHGVSGMGRFDGELSSVVLMIPSGEFHPESPYPGRREFTELSYYRRKDGFVMPMGNVMGTTLLNGVGELVAMNLPVTKAIKAPSQSLLANPAEQVVVGNFATELKRITPKEGIFEAAARIAAEHPEVMTRIRGAILAVAPRAFGDLAHPGIARDGIEMFIDGVLHHPEKMRILGRTLEAMDPNRRFQLAQVLSREGLGEFQQWYGDHVSELQKLDQSQTFERILSLNLMQFAEAWIRYSKGTFKAPDYEALERDIRDLQNGAGVMALRYPLSAKLVDGLQSSAVAVFIEDYLLTRHSKAIER